MKKTFSLLLMAVLFATNGVFAQKGFVNPSALYVEAMGYEYKVIKTAEGPEQGVAVLPNGEQVSAWDLYKGKVAPEYSYCATKGMTVKTKVQTNDGYKSECAVCVSGSNLKSSAEVPMIELMRENGDLPEQVSRSQEVEAIENAEVDPEFKVASSLPESFDWRNVEGKTFIGPVRSQGGCGSCYAFGAVANAECVYNVANNLTGSSCADFSEAYIAFCLSKMSPYSGHFNGCSGADYTYSELQALVDIGVCEESYFPYSESSTSCPEGTVNAPKIKFDNWLRAPCNDVDAIKTAIMTYGVVDAAVYVTTDFQGYSGGIFKNSSTSCEGSPCSYTTTNHAIALVGWGHDEEEGDYWILRNSWGENWGENGYMRITVASARVGCSVAYLTLEPQGEVKVTGVSINPESVSVGVNETENLAATILPANATDKSVVWSSSNTSVATVSTTGEVSAVAIGNATITVKTNDGGFTDKCEVTVVESTDDGGPLTDGVTANGKLDKADGMDMWYIEVPAGIKSMHVVMECGNEDFDTYGLFNSEPTVSNYDWRGYSDGSEENTVTNPEAGRHYIMVDHYAGSGSYTLKVTLNQRDDEVGKPLTPGIASNGSIENARSSEFWYIDVPANTGVLDVVLNCDSGDVDMYGSFNQAPVDGNFDWVEYTPGGEKHTIENPAEGRHYIMAELYSGSGAYTIMASLSPKNRMFSAIEENSTSTPKVYPNPTNDYITIDAGSIIKEVSVYDATGKLVLRSENFNRTAKLALSDYAKGIYTLRIKTDSGVSVQKIIKE